MVVYMSILVWYGFDKSYIDQLDNIQLLSLYELITHIFPK